MTRAERRELRRNVRDMRAQARLHWHPDARRAAAGALVMLERAERDDPRPGFWLRWRLRMEGIDVG